MKKVYNINIRQSRRRLEIFMKLEVLQENLEKKLFYYDTYFYFEGTEKKSAQ